MAPRKRGASTTTMSDGQDHPKMRLQLLLDEEVSPRNGPHSERNLIQKKKGYGFDWDDTEVGRPQTARGPLRFVPMTWGKAVRSAGKNASDESKREHKVNETPERAPKPNLSINFAQNPLCLSSASISARTRLDSNVSEGPNMKVGVEALDSFSSPTNSNLEQKITDNEAIEQFLAFLSTKLLPGEEMSMLRKRKSLDCSGSVKQTHAEDTQRNSSAEILDEMKGSRKSGRLAVVPHSSISKSSLKVIETWLNEMSKRYMQSLGVSSDGNKKETGFGSSNGNSSGGKAKDGSGAGPDEAWSEYDDSSASNKMQSVIEFRSPLDEMGLSREILKKRGLSDNGVDHLYMSFFVYSVGFSEMTRRATRHCSSTHELQSAIWEVFMHLTEQSNPDMYGLALTSMRVAAKQMHDSVKVNEEARLRTLHSKISTIKTEIRVVREQLLATQTLCEEETKNIRDLQDRLIEQREEFESQSEAVDDATHIVSEWQSVLDRETLKYNAATGVLKNRTTEWNAVQTEIRHLRADIEKSKEDREGLLRSMDDAQMRIKNTMDEYGIVAEEDRVVVEQMRKQEVVLQVWNTANDSEQRELSAIQSLSNREEWKRARVEEEHAQLEEEHKQKQLEIASMEAETSEMKAATEVATNSKKAYDVELRDLREAFVEKDNQKIAVQHDLEDVLELHRSKVDRLTFLQKKIAQHIQAAQMAHITSEKLTSECSNLQNTLVLCSEKESAEQRQYDDWKDQVAGKESVERSARDLLGRLVTQIDEKESESESLHEVIHKGRVLNLQMERDLMQSNDNLQKEVEELKERERITSERLSEVHTEHSDLNQQTTSLESIISLESRTLKDMEATVVTLHDEVASVTFEEATLLAEVSALEQAQMVRREDLTVLRENVSRLSQEDDLLRTSLDTMIHETKEKLVAGEREEEQLTDEKRHIEVRFHADVEKAERQRDRRILQVKAEIDRLNIQLRDAMKERNAANNELECARTELKITEERQSEALLHLNELKGGVSDVEDALRQALSTNCRRSAAQKKFIRERTRLDECYESLVTECSDASNLLGHLLTQIADMEARSPQTCEAMAKLEGQLWTKQNRLRHQSSQIEAEFRIAEKGVNTIEPQPSMSHSGRRTGVIHNQGESKLSHAAIPFGVDAAVGSTLLSLDKMNALHAQEENGSSRGGPSLLAAASRSSNMKIKNNKLGRIVKKISVLKSMGVVPPKKVNQPNSRRPSVVSLLRQSQNGSRRSSTAGKTRTRDSIRETSFVIIAEAPHEEEEEVEKGDDKDIGHDGNVPSYGMCEDSVRQALAHRPPSGKRYSSASLVHTVDGDKNNGGNFTSSTDALSHDEPHHSHLLIGIDDRVGESACASKESKSEPEARNTSANDVLSSSETQEEVDTPLPHLSLQRQVKANKNVETAEVAGVENLETSTAKRVPLVRGDKEAKRTKSKRRSSLPKSKEKERVPLKMSMASVVVEKVNARTEKRRSSDKFLRWKQNIEFLKANKVQGEEPSHIEDEIHELKKMLNETCSEVHSLKEQSDKRRKAMNKARLGVMTAAKLSLLISQPLEGTEEKHESSIPPESTNNNIDASSTSASATSISSMEEDRKGGNNHGHKASSSIPHSARGSASHGKVGARSIRKNRKVSASANIHPSGSVTHRGRSADRLSRSSFEGDNSESDLSDTPLSWLVHAESSLSEHSMESLESLVSDDLAVEDGTRHSSSQPHERRGGRKIPSLSARSHRPGQMQSPVSHRQRTFSHSHNRMGTQASGGRHHVALDEEASAFIPRHPRGQRSLSHNHGMHRGRSHHTHNTEVNSIRPHTTADNTSGRRRQNRHPSAPSEKQREGRSHSVVGGDSSLPPISFRRTGVHTATNPRGRPSEVRSHTSANRGPNEEDHRLGWDDSVSDVKEQFEEEDGFLSSDEGYWEEEDEVTKSFLRAASRGVPTAFHFQRSNQWVSSEDQVQTPSMVRSAPIAVPIRADDDAEDMGAIAHSARRHHAPFHYAGTGITIPTFADDSPASSPRASRKLAKKKHVPTRNHSVKGSKALPDFVRRRIGTSGNR